MAMTLGLATGMGYIGIAVIFFIVVALFQITMCTIHFGEEDNCVRDLRVTIPEDLDYDGIFDDIFKRYADGEMTEADSIKVNKDEVYYTVGGREVYGGGGIVPDVFVPIDTTKVTSFYMQCTRKATTMRYASAFFDGHKAELSSIDTYDALLKYLDDAGLESGFLRFAAEKDGIKPENVAEWKESAEYMMPQIRALIGRYSKLGDKAYYHIFLEIDETYKKALN